MTQLMLCSFTYTAFALAFIYLVLFFFVLRYLGQCSQELRAFHREEEPVTRLLISRWLFLSCVHAVNLMRQNATGKKVAQKVFLAILIAQTLRQEHTHKDNALGEANIDAARPMCIWLTSLSALLCVSVRVLYFLLFPFNNSSCHPANSGEARESTTSAAWWIHLLSNLPAELFLLAFSVLVFTFARIYHRVL